MLLTGKPSTNEDFSQELEKKIDFAEKRRESLQQLRSWTKMIAVINLTEGEDQVKRKSSFMKRV